MSLVLDNSAALAFLYADEVDASAEALLQRVAREGARVPPLFHAELANGLLNSTRRGRITPDECQLALQALGNLPIETDHLDPTSAALVFLGEHYRLTAYDAWYLYLALSRGLPLATRDAALRTAAKSVGVELLDA